MKKKKKIIVEVDEALYRKLKVTCAKNGVTMKSVIQFAIMKTLEK